MSIYAQSKICTKCGINKPISDYYKDKTKLLGIRCACKSCINNQHYNWRKNNPDKWSDYMSQYRQENADSIKSKSKSYKDINKEKLRIQQREYQINRRDLDPLFKTQSLMRNVLNKALKRKGYTKRSKTNDIIGCDWQMLKEHIENQFTEEMNWDNHGTYWDIDHIIPLSNAKTEEEVLKLNHYTNLQPLESFYNRHIKRGNIL